MPEHEEAMMLKASVLLVQEKPGSAAALLEGLIAKGSSRPEVHHLLGSAYAREGRNQEAEKILLKGIAGNPQSAPLRVALARLYAEGGRVKEAMAAMDEVIALEPGAYAHREALAGLHWRAGEKEKPWRSSGARYLPSPKMKSSGSGWPAF
jgi:predicted Zn-dependent protease